MSKKTVEQLCRELCREYQRKMQKLVDKKDSGITGISIEVGGEKHIIAEKKNPKDNK